MKTGGLLFGAALLVLCLAGAALADNSGRIYGVITTIDGETFEGLIRWDKNEANWVDVLDGTKDRDGRRDYYGQSRRKYHNESRSKLKILGLTIGGDEQSVWYTGAHSCGVRFGHIKLLEVVDDDRAILTLKNNEEIELTGSSTDIGSAVREIVIEDKDEGEIEFIWDDIETIEFMSAKTNERSSFGKRLYGTMTTRRGDEYTGFVAWDVDEVFENDILDGEERRRSRKIKFDKIAAIERYSSSGAVVILKSGDEVVLRNSNDVDDSNRGVAICDPDLGMVTAQWDEFEKLTFKDIPKEVSYDDFRPSQRIYGTVYTEDGDEYTGTVVWDDDEEYTWELLNGEDRDLEFEIEFGLIKEIRKNSYRSATVVLKDGREFRLRGSNDVDEDNNGIFVEMDDGGDVIIDWDEFDRLELSRK